MVLIMTLMTSMVTLMALMKEFNGMVGKINRHARVKNDIAFVF